MKINKKRYKHLSKENKDIIKTLTEEGKSLSFISNLMGFGKTTIYYQVRKFKPRIKKDFIVNISDFQIGELIGAFAGDGSYYHEYKKCSSNRSSHYRIRYFLSYAREADYAEYLKNILIKLNLNPHLIKRDKSVLILTVNSKDFINFIMQYLVWKEDKTFTIRLKKHIFAYSNNFLRGFARGLMDTDGFLNSGNAVCACISKRLIDNLSSIFSKFNLNYTRTNVHRDGNRRTLFYVRVSKQSLDKYQKSIGFSGKYKADTLRGILKNRIRKS